jgi:hypothetical protein
VIHDDAERGKVPRAGIAEMKQLPTSLMPPGLDKALNAEQLRDLMSYLLTPTPTRKP